MKKTNAFFGMLAGAAMLAACTSSREVQYIEVPLARAETDIAQEQLLSVGILVFDEGLPEDAGEQELNNRFIFPEIRRAEARYMPYHLKNTLESTGFWGAVSVLPDFSPVTDIHIAARIDHSDGYSAKLRRALPSQAPASVRRTHGRPDARGPGAGILADRCRQ